MSNIDHLLDFLNDDSETMDEITLEGTADENLIFLTALQNECTPEEFDTILESAMEMELYGLIDSAEALEAQKNIVRLNKFAQLSREEKKACLRLAARANDPEYRKYSKHRKLMIESRTKIMDKYESKGRAAARKIIANARRKASSMKSSVGKSITDKMDKTLARVNKDGRNKTAINK